MVFSIEFVSLSIMKSSPFAPAFFTLQFTNFYALFRQDFLSSGITDNIGLCDLRKPKAG